MASTEATEVEIIITSVLTSNPCRSTIKRLCDDFRNIVGYNIPFRKFGFPTAEDYLRSIPQTVRIIGSGFTAEVEGVVTHKSAHINELVAKQRKGNIPTHKRKIIKAHGQQSLQNKNSNINHFDRNINESNKLSIFEDNYKSRVPKRIQNNLRKVILNFPEGITCTRLQNEYQKTFREPLNFERFRFRSLIELCSDLSDIFHYIQEPTGDFILYSKNKAIPSLDQNEVCKIVEDPLDIDWSLGLELIPSKVVQFLEEIPTFSLRDINNGDYLDISLGEVYDINRFWIFPKYGDLLLIEDELQICFQNDRNRYVIPEIFLQKGLYCVVYHNKKYHRCIIVDTLPEVRSYVQVLFIDYGSVGEINHNNIWYLPKEYSRIPCQAVRARLSSIRAVNSSTTNEFRELTLNAELVAEVTKVNKSEQLLELYLADVTDQNNIYYINDCLVKKGLAEYSLQ